MKTSIAALRVFISSEKVLFYVIVCVFNFSGEQDKLYRTSSLHVLVFQCVVWCLNKRTLCAAKNNQQEKVQVLPQQGSRTSKLLLRSPSEMSHKQHRVL